MFSLKDQELSSWDMKKREFENQIDLEDRKRINAIAVEKFKSSVSAQILYTTIMMEKAKVHITNIKDYGIMTVRSVFLLNAGAVVGILTFAGNLAAKVGTPVQIPLSFWVWPLAAFVAGLISAVLGMFFAYRNFDSHVGAIPHPSHFCSEIINARNHWIAETDEAALARIRSTARGSIIAGIVSVIFFVFGCLFVGWVFYHA